MTVVDASVAVDLLLGAPWSPAGEDLAALVAGGAPLAAPDLLDVEASQVLRRFVLGGELQAEAATAAIQDLVDLPVDRYPGRVLIRRAFELRDNVTVYDAVYLALAEVLDRPLLTGDAKLSAVPGCQAEVIVAATHR